MSFNEVTRVLTSSRPKENSAIAHAARRGDADILDAILKQMNNILNEQQVGMMQSHLHETRHFSGHASVVL